MLLATVAVAISTAAFAKDLKGTVMTDSEMDKVTAGAGTDVAPATQAGTGLGIAGTAAGFSVPAAAASTGLTTANAAIAAH
jgi:hypothetical protein